MSRSSVPEPPSFSARLRASGAGETLARSSGYQSGQLRAGEQRLVQLIARFNEYPAAVALHRHQRDTGPAQCVDVALDGAARHLKPLRQRGHGAFFGLQQDRDDADETVDLHRAFLKKRPAGGRAILRPVPDAAAFSKTCGRQPSARTLRFSFSYTRVRIHSSVEASTASSSMNQRTPLFSSGFARSASPASASSR